MRYPTITKGNIDTWESITYCYIINGMIKANPDRSYGEHMRYADALTIRLFRALKRDMRKKK